jgi:beta-glucanase (GH16 family)
MHVLTHLPRLVAIALTVGMATTVLAGVPAGATASSTSAATTVSTKRSTTLEYQLDLVENFDRLDESRWTIWHERNRGGGDRTTLLQDNVRVTPQGWLRVTARPDGGTATHPYTSGALDTYTKYVMPRYWMVKVRARIPAQQGLQSAPLWFRPNPEIGGEIDLIEGVSRKRRIFQTLHSDYNVGEVRGRARKHFRHVGDPAGTGWHVYTVKKLPGRIVMHVDGKRTAVFRKEDMPAGAFRSDFGLGAVDTWSMRINLQVGTAWSGLPDSSTDWSKTHMDIDWIKTWRVVRKAA